MSSGADSIAWGEKLVELLRATLAADPSSASFEKLRTSARMTLGADLPPAIVPYAPPAGILPTDRDRTIDVAAQVVAAEALVNVVASLRAADPAERLIRRKLEAKWLGISASALDTLVAGGEERPTAGTVQSSSIAPAPPPPWSEPVAANVVLDELLLLVGRFIVADDHALIAATLWIGFTYFFDVAETSPRLAILSPTPRCGKSRLLELLAMLCPSAIAASNLTPSAIFRLVDSEKCVLLIDEADSFTRDNKSTSRSEEFRGILNSGHTRSSAYVIRSVAVGDDWVPKKFSTWAPVAVASIGKQPETWIDRSIVIPLRRKLRSQSVERLVRQNRAARVQAAAIASKLARLAADFGPVIAAATPEPAALESDRAIDNWEHLLAIADLAGGDWPVLARSAAVALSGGSVEGESNLGVKLLIDIKSIFESSTSPEIGSVELCTALCAMTESPWSAISRGRALTPARLARMLREFSISARRSAVQRGYAVADFDDAFARYIPVPPDQSVKASQSTGSVGGNDDFNVSSDDTLKSADSHTERRSSDTMTPPKRGYGSDHDFSTPETPEGDRF